MASENTLGSRDSLLDVRGLTIDFWNQDHWVNVVDDVSFSVRPGESLGLVGESGCGKTTIAYTLLAYRRPNSRIRRGDVSFRGDDLLHMRGKALQDVRGKRIALVPQNPTTALSPGMTAGRQIAEVLAAHRIGANDGERWERAVELLAQVQLPDPAASARKYPHQLSGGQQQRVVIGMALACQPDLVVLDEPTTGLDVTTQAQILELLTYLRAEHTMTMVYVTHDLGVISLICDRVGVMYAGKLVEDAPIRELFRNPRHPYTRGLIASVPSVRHPQRNQGARLRGLLKREDLPPGCRFAPRCAFALERCYGEPQSLQPVATGHEAACWRWPDIPALAVAETSIAPLLNPPVPAANPLLEVTALDIGYASTDGLLMRRKVKQVVHNAAFDIRPGETFALVGESGSGKSTIARTVAGLLQPLSGHVTFQGQDIGQRVRDRSQNQRRDIQLVFQNPDASLNPRQRVIQIIGQPLRKFFGLRGRLLRERVEALLADVRLDSSYANRYPDELSGGERQRIAIARALAAKPVLMLCDEVLSALDVSVQATILDLLRALQAEHRIAYLFISHDLAVVHSLAHRVGVLYRGELCEVGSVADVYAPPYHPYTHALFSAVPEVEAGASIRPAVKTELAPTVAIHSACPFADRCPWKLGPICDEVVPPWQFTSESHKLRCHIPLEELRRREVWTQTSREPATSPPTSMALGET